MTEPSMTEPDFTALLKAELDALGRSDLAASVAHVGFEEVFINQASGIIVGAQLAVWSTQPHTEDPDSAAAIMNAANQVGARIGISPCCTFEMREEYVGLAEFK
jgi:hypothetical protein